MGSNWNYSCLWYLDLWFIKACLVGQCLWHIGQENPVVETCLASTWFWTWDIFFELYPHSVHCQRPSSFLNMRLSTRMFRASIVSAWGPSSRGIGYVCSLLINFEHIWHHAFCTDGTWGNCVSDKIVGRWSTQNQAKDVHPARPCSNISSAGCFPSRPRARHGRVAWPAPQYFKTATCRVRSIAFLTSISAHFAVQQENLMEVSVTKPVPKSFQIMQISQNSIFRAGWQPLSSNSIGTSAGVNVPFWTFCSFHNFSLLLQFR